MARLIQQLTKSIKTSLAFILLYTPAWASIPIKNTPIPGGIAVVDFQSESSNPKAFYNQVPLLVQHIYQDHYQVLFGIPLMTTPGEKTLRIEDDKTTNISFIIKDHQYKAQHIKLTGKKKKFVNPNLAHMDRIKLERPILSKARKTYSDQLFVDSAFIRPADGVTTSPFGLKRFYNGEPRRPHTGLDFAGDIGTPIKAPANGRVILTGDFFFNGNSVFIDHGKGLISVYIHMNEIKVENNQMLQTGDIIGTIGKTGRSTGAHLHWGVYLNHTAVDPSLFLGQE